MIYVYDKCDIMVCIICSMNIISIISNISLFSGSRAG